jgi:hypothetical protein
MESRRTALVRLTRIADMGDRRCDAIVRFPLYGGTAVLIDLPTTGGHRTNTSAAIALEPGSTPANGRESAISVEGLAKRFGNLEAVSGAAVGGHN